jgi:hypothetical protein
MLLNKKRLVASILYILLAAGAFDANANDAPLWKEVGQWTVKVDPTLGNGCFLFALYEKGTVFRIGINSESDVGYLILGNSEWRSLERGKDYNIRIQFDDEVPWEAIATGIDLDAGTAFLYAEFSKTEFFQEFATKHVVEFHYSNKLIARLSLRDSYEALEELHRCQRAMWSSPTDDRPSDPFSSEPAASDPFAS